MAASTGLVFPAGSASGAPGVRLARRYSYQWPLGLELGELLLHLGRRAHDDEPGKPGVRAVLDEQRRLVEHDVRARRYRHVVLRGRGLEDAGLVGRRACGRLVSDAAALQRGFDECAAFAYARLVPERAILFLERNQFAGTCCVVRR